MKAQTPVVDIGFSTLSFYTGDTIKFYNLSTSVDTNTFFYWNFGIACGISQSGALIIDQCNDTVNGLQSMYYCYTQPGIYKMKLTADVNGTQVFSEKFIQINQGMTYGCNGNENCNLIRNGDFEDINSCPTAAANLGYGLSLAPVPSTSCYWFNPTQASPDLFINATNGYGPCNINTLPLVPSPFSPFAPFNGNGMIGIHTYNNNGLNYREYIEQPLTHKLELGKSYTLSFLARQSQCVGTELQVALVSGAVSDYATIFDLRNSNNFVNSISQVLPPSIVINDPNNWQLVQMTFTANSDCYDYIIIGNIDDDASSLFNPTISTNPNCNTFYSFVLIDDVSLYATNGLDAIVENNCGSNGSISLDGLCNTSTTIYNAPFTYLWNNGSTDNNISNLSPGNYTVTVTDNNGLTVSETFTISAGNLPTPPIISGNHDACNPDHLVFVTNVQPGLVYSWGTDVGIYGTGTQCNIDFYTTTGNGNGIITFYTYDPITCCTNSSSFIVAACCLPFDGGNGVNLDLSNLSASALAQNWTNYPGFIVSPNPVKFTTQILNNPNYQAAINSVFTVDQDMQIFAANIVLGPDARIEVINGATLTIHEFSWLHTCDQQYMWNRINVAPGCTLIIEEQANIEEAQLAVDINDNAVLICSNSYFNRNYRSVVFNGTGNSQFPNSSIAGTEFTSIVKPFNILGPIGVAPHLADRSYSGIETNNLLDANMQLAIQIGNYTNGTFPINSTIAPNIFNNLDYGIVSDNCDIAVYNCNFYNINDAAHPDLISGLTGTAIKINKSSTPQITKTEIGGNALGTYSVTHQPNNFFNCKRGLYMTRTNAVVSYNHYSNITYAGIHANNGAGSEFLIDSNDFLNCNRGFLARNMNHVNQIIVTRNYYNHQNTYQPPANVTNWVRMAFAIHNFIKGPITGYMQFNNNCKGFKTCFSLINVVDYSIGSNDPIVMDNGALNSERYGIRLTGCERTRIRWNKIKFDLNISNINTVWRGISIEGSSEINVIENTFLKLGTGLRFYNCNAQQYVQCNNFNGCYRGVELNSSWIGDQGTNKQPSSPSDNMWFNQPVGFYDAFGVLPYTPSIWYVRSNSYPYAPLWQTPILPFKPAPYQIVTNPPQYNCNPPAISDDEIVERLLIVITQSDFYADLSDDVQHRMTAQAYADLMNNPVLMNRGTSEDAILQNFVDSIAQTDIGYLFEVNNSIQNSDSATAIEYNDYVTGVNSQDENAAIVNDIYLNHLNEDEFIFDTTTIAQLENIAFQNPIEGGTAIYGAIVLLDLNIDHEAFGYSLRQEFSEAKNEKELFDAFPNPAKEQVTLIARYNLEGNTILEITDALGQPVLSKEISNNIAVTLIDTKKLHNGIYCLRIQKNNSIIFKKKFVILK